jgi:hypothetical protein
MATQNTNTEAAAVEAARAALNKKASAAAPVQGVSVDQLRAAALTFLNSRSNDKKASVQQPLGLTIMTKIASRDFGGLRVLCALDGLNKIAEQATKADKADKPFVDPATTDAFKNLWESIKGGISNAGKTIGDATQKGFNSAAQWLADPTHLKQLGIGAATTGGIYGLSWLLPNARHTHGLRLLASILGGTTAGAYGDNILNAIAGNGFITDAEKDFRRANEAEMAKQYDEKGNFIGNKTASVDKKEVLKGILAKHGL